MSDVCSQFTRTLMAHAERMIVDNNVPKAAVALLGKGRRPAPAVAIKQKRTTIGLISLEMFNALEWTKNDEKHLLKHLFRKGVQICQKYSSQTSKTLKNRQN